MKAARNPSLKLPEAKLSHSQVGETRPSRATVAAILAREAVTHVK